MDKLVYRIADDTGRDGVLSIEFAPPGSMARKVVSRSNTRPTGRFPSAIAGMPLCWDSPAELNWLRLIHCSPLVKAVASQPCVIHYRLDGRKFRHYPDSLVATAHDRTLWEVKTAADARRPEVAARTKLLVEQCPWYGYKYGVALAEDLRRQPRLSNACQVLRHGRRPLSFEQREGCRHVLQSTSALLWADVVNNKHAPLNLAAACRLLLEGRLYIDLDLPLDDQLLKVVHKEEYCHG